MIKLKENQTIEDFTNCITHLQTLLNEDLVITISNLEKVISFSQGEIIKLPVKLGDKVNPQWALGKCLKEKKLLNVFVPKEVMGISYRAIVNPIFDSKGKLLGAVAIAKNAELKNELIDLSTNISKSLKEIDLNTTSMSHNANLMVESQTKMASVSKQTEYNMSETDQVLDFIKGIAHKTNMLGINAAIEAARAGDSASGFKVVSEEIRKLSVSSNEAVSKIQEILEKSKSSIRNIVEEVDVNKKSIENQAKFLTEVNTSIEQLSSVSDTLNNLSKLI